MICQILSNCELVIYVVVSKSMFATSEPGENRFLRTVASFNYTFPPSIRLLARKLNRARPGYQPASRVWTQKTSFLWFRSKELEAGSQPTKPPSSMSNRTHLLSDLQNCSFKNFKYFWQSFCTKGLQRNFKISEYNVSFESCWKVCHGYTQPFTLQSVAGVGATNKMNAGSKSKIRDYGNRKRSVGNWLPLLDCS